MGPLEAFFAVALTFTVTYAYPPATLEILPKYDHIRSIVGSSLALTCKPNVQDPKLITQMEWRDPKNRRIEDKNKASPIYIQSIDSESGLMLIFSSVTENHAGNYTCSASYANTEQIKATVTVSTFIDITFVEAPESQYPKVGTDFTIKCKVQGNPAPLIDWNKNGQTIMSEGRYIVDSEGLLIKNVRESDDGVYKCTAVVLATGQIKARNIKVEVLVPPKIEMMKEISVIEGETASTKCVATGKPPPVYTWIKENTRQDLSKTDRFDVRKNTGELIINRVEFNDNAMYKCTAENQAGIAETNVKINVLVKPKIYELLNVTAPINAETKIICKAQGRPNPNILFRKLSNKEPFRVGPQLEDKRIILEQQYFEEKGEAFGTLIISDLNRTDDGLYECIAENSAGKAFKNGHITVEFTPTFERTKNFSSFAWSWENKPGNLTCLPEAIPNATVIWKYNGKEIIDGPNFKKIGNGPISHLIVKPMHDHRFFTQYECIATNKHGSSSIFIKLKEAKVPSYITQVKPQTITATTIKFNIQPPSYFDSLPIRSFTVQYRRESEVSWDYSRNHTWSFNAPYILENLIPEVTYHFRFAASNDVGLGPFTNAETITMPRRSEPAEPKIFVPNHILDENSSIREIVVVSPYADHFELRWNVPNDNGDPIDGYLIRYCVIEKVNGNWRDNDCSEEIKQSVQYTSYELNDLKADTTYKIELRAHNAIGSSSPAQIRVKTARGIDPAIPYNEPSISSLTIIGIVIAVILIILILVDATCYCANRSGILAFFCNLNKTKHTDEEDPKLGRDEREPLKPENNHHHHQNNINGIEKPMSVEYDGRHVYSKSGELLGKHSAV